MIELKRENVHRIVATEQEAQDLVYEGYVRLTPLEKKEVKDVLPSAEDFGLTIEKIDSMSFLEMKEIAKALKIKGYTNMGKSFLNKALKELV